MKNVGGQAVLEGVMMRGSACVATSVRTPEGVIETLVEPIIYNSSALRKTPVVRGVFNLVDAMSTGLRVMNYSASFFEEDSQESSKSYELLDRLSGGRAEKISSVFTIGLSLGLALLFFTVLPTVFARLIMNDGGNRLALNFLEAAIKILLFVIYLLAISRIPEIHRVFKYHGAEHKVIDAYEHNLELTVENVRKSSRYHARCGTNFMFLVLVVSVVVFSFVPSFNPLVRVGAKILLIPLVAGLTFELIIWLGANESALSKAISFPGKMMQRITTSEPDDSMIEVAIAALKRSENIPYTIKDLKAYADERLKGMDGGALDRDVILSHVTGLDRAYCLAHPEAKIDYAQYDEFRKLIDQRKKYKPVSYITGHKEFMGLDFLVTEATLIPRPDTETLVETAASFIRKHDAQGAGLKILDLCSGSGAIGLSLLAMFPHNSLVLSDISAEAMAVARLNAEKLGLMDQTEFVVNDLFEGINTDFNFDVILSNPPYIKSQDLRTLPKDVREFEPKKALDGGKSGLDFYERISDKARQYITDGGSLFFEIGADQGLEVTNILKKYNWQDPEVINDLAGRSRVIRASWIRDL